MTFQSGRDSYCNGSSSCIFLLRLQRRWLWLRLLPLLSVGKSISTAVAIIITATSPLKRVKVNTLQSSRLWMHSELEEVPLKGASRRSTTNISPSLSYKGGFKGFRKLRTYTSNSPTKLVPPAQNRNPPRTMALTPTLFCLFSCALALAVECFHLCRGIASTLTTPSPKPYKP